MKIVLLVIGLTTLLATVGCEGTREHRGGNYGGAYDSYEQGSGRGEYQGYPNYHGYTYGYPD